MEFKVNVENVPSETDRYIVARADYHTQEFWYYGTWEDKAQATEIAKMIDGYVLERLE